MRESRLSRIRSQKLSNSHRRLLSQLQEAQEIEAAGDSFFIVFVKPSDAVKLDSFCMRA